MATRHDIFKEHLKAWLKAKGNRKARREITKHVCFIAAVHPKSVSRAFRRAQMRSVSENHRRGPRTTYGPIGVPSPKNGSIGLTESSSTLHTVQWRRWPSQSALPHQRHPLASLPSEENSHSYYDLDPAILTPNPRISTTAFAVGAHQRDHHVAEGIPIPRLQEILKKYNRLAAPVPARKSAD